MSHSKTLRGATWENWTTAVDVDGCGEADGDGGGDGGDGGGCGCSCGSRKAAMGSYKI